MAKRNRSTASQLLKLYSNHVDAHDARQRLAERDAREAADTRTPAQRWLNEPPPGRSALARSSARPNLDRPTLRSAGGTRVDLWRLAAKTK